MTELHPVDPETGRRIEAAFASLLTAEVPASAPRPAAAPRPGAEPSRRSRRRLGLAGGGLLVAAAAVAVALLLGGEVEQARPRPSVPAVSTTPPTTATTPPRSPSSPPVSTAPTTPAPGTQVSSPSAAEVAAAVRARAAAAAASFASVGLDTRSEVVAVPGGFEGADVGGGTIRFWRSTDAATWTVVGTSTYPPDATPAAAYTATISAAALLTGMDTATFVVTGDAFTGDSTGSTLAYSDGPQGWGVVKAGDDGLLHPSGDGFPALGTTNAANAGLSYDESLVDGQLRTVDCSSTAPTLGGCGDPQYQVVKYWAWDGKQFVLDRREGPAS